MGNYIKEKAKNNTVTYDCGGKYHFYKVKSKNDEHEVIIKLSCTCKYMSTQGFANNKICSHIYSVLDKIREDGQIEQIKRGANNER